MSLRQNLQTAAFFGLVIFTPGARGADVQMILPNSLEIGAFAGASYGIDQFRVMGGGNVSWAPPKGEFRNKSGEVFLNIMPYAEYSYFPGIKRTFKGTFDIPGSMPILVEGTAVVPLSDFHGGVHLRFRIHEKPFAPYGVIGLGAVTHFDTKYVSNYTDPSGFKRSPQSTVPGGADFAVNFGGGIRYYVTQRLGFRVEAKMYKPTGPGTFGDVFGKVEAGIFWQLK